MSKTKTKKYNYAKHYWHLALRKGERVDWFKAQAEKMGLSPREYVERLIDERREKLI